ncbi:MAG: hypothetical protein QNJ44_03065 [Rhodobacter sp.]|nr:hypothetical protein [Rhodobacter sp.]
MPVVEARDEIVENFYRVRRMLGYLGLALPLTLILGGLPFDISEPSLSDYFHTLMRDIFVGIIFAIGVFLLCYTGFRPKSEERFSDDLVTTLAGIAALLVAFVPNRGTLNTSNDPQALAQHIFGVTACDYMHHAAAGTFLLCMAYLAGFRFARTAKPMRRRIYVGCAWIIFAGFLLTCVSAGLRKLGTPAQTAFVVDNQLVFWFEAIGVWAFSIAWLVKGQRDREIIRAARADGQGPDIAA